MWVFDRNFSNTIRDSHVNHLFDNEAHDSPCVALVREGIQNSLDAQEINDNPVRVRISINENEDFTFGTFKEELFDGLIRHLSAEDNYMGKIPDFTGDKCRTITFEDFNTTGLTGDTKSKWNRKDQNSFQAFYRVEGKSIKDDERGGKWGIGKAAFMRASKINTIFCYTVRYDDKRKLAFGRSVLNNHFINEELYGQDGYFAIEGNEETPLHQPYENQEMIDSICSFGKLTRTNEPGLSVIVPWIKDDCTFSDIVNAVVGSYLWPIITERLVVEIVSESRVETISHNTIYQVLDNSYYELSNYRSMLQSLHDFKESFADDITNLNIKEVGSDYVIDVDSSKSQIDALSKKYIEHQPCSIKVDLPVVESTGEIQHGHLKIFLWPLTEDDRHKPILIRDIIHLVEFHKHKKYSRFLIAIICDRASKLSSLIGSLENVSHTNMTNERETKFSNSKQVRKFIERLPGRLIKLLEPQDNFDDEYLLNDLFDLDHSQESGKKISRKKGKKKVKVDNSLRQLRIDAIQGGFSVSGVLDSSLPCDLYLQTAYRVHLGSAFRKYSKLDFDLSNGFTIGFQDGDMSVMKADKNEIVVRVMKAEVNFKVVGFDENRAVDVDMKRIQE